MAGLSPDETARVPAQVVPVNGRADRVDLAAAAGGTVGSFVRRMETAGIRLGSREAYGGRSERNRRLVGRGQYDEERTALLCSPSSGTAFENPWIAGCRARHVPALLDSATVSAATDVLGWVRGEFVAREV